jgi:hypothetical protein
MSKVETDIFPSILLAALFDDILVLIETIIIRYHPLYIKHNYHHT